MIVCSASSIRELFAETIVQCSCEPSQTELIALAWALRNRAERLRQALGKGGELTAAEARELSRALLADMGIKAARRKRRANGNGDAGRARDSRTFQQALACVALVFDGLLPDPTKGASRVHRHDEEPGWADGYEATALIGALMFLRSGEEAGQPRRSESA